MVLRPARWTTSPPPLTSARLQTTLQVLCALRKAAPTPSEVARPRSPDTPAARRLKARARSSVGRLLSAASLRKTGGAHARSVTSGLRRRALRPRGARAQAAWWGPAHASGDTGRVRRPKAAASHLLPKRPRVRHGLAATGESLQAERQLSRAVTACLRAMRGGAAEPPRRFACCWRRRWLPSRCFTTAAEGRC